MELNIDKLIGNNIEVNDGDYLKNDVWYCGKCNTPKQKIISIAGIEYKPMMLCECQTVERDNLDEQIKFEEQKRQIEQNRNSGFSKAEMQHWTFETDDNLNPKMTTMALNYVEHFDEMYKSGKGLLLHGNIGSGKSYLAACIANKLIDNNNTCLMTNFNKIINRLSEKFEGRQDILDNLMNYDLLIIDDLGAERNTEYVNEIMFAIIDARYRSGKPLIITTNLDLKEMAENTNLDRQRIYSRIFEMCIPVEFKGSDRRKDTLKQEYGNFKKILGL